MTEGLVYVRAADGAGVLVAGLGNATDRKIVLPARYRGEAVIGVAEKAFYKCKQLTEIVLGEGISVIGDFAFDFCTALTAAVLPKSLRRIGKSAFGCSALREITLPEGVCEVGDRAFAYCDELALARIGDGVRAIGENAFLGCDKLREIQFSSPHDWRAEGVEIPRAVLADGGLAARCLTTPYYAARNWQRSASAGGLYYLFAHS